MHKIVGVCDVCFKEPNESEIEAILNSIVSIMVSVSRYYLKLLNMCKACLFGMCKVNNLLVLLKNIMNFVIQVLNIFPKAWFGTV